MFQQIVGGAAAPEHVALPEGGDGVRHLGARAERGQCGERRREAGDGRLAQLGIGQGVPGRVLVQRVVRRGPPSVRSASGLTAR